MSWQEENTNETPFESLNSIIGKWIACSLAVVAVTVVVFRLENKYVFYVLFGIHTTPFDVSVELSYWNSIRWARTGSENSSVCLTHNAECDSNEPSVCVSSHYHRQLCLAMTFLCLDVSIFPLPLLLYAISSSSASRYLHAFKFVCNCFCFLHFSKEIMNKLLTSHKWSALFNRVLLRVISRASKKLQLRMYVH